MAKNGHDRFPPSLRSPTTEAIFVMERIHREGLNQNYGRFLAGKPVAVLGIPNNYDDMDPDLVTLLRLKCARYLR